MYLRLEGNIPPPPQDWKKFAKNQMLIFGLHSTSDDQPSNPSDKSCLKCERIATKSSKNEMLIFELHSTFDDWPSNPSDESHLKCKKNGCQTVKN